MPFDAECAVCIQCDWIWLLFKTFCVQVMTKIMKNNDMVIGHFVVLSYNKMVWRACSCLNWANQAVIYVIGRIFVMWEMYEVSKAQYLFLMILHC